MILELEGLSSAGARMYVRKDAHISTCNFKQVSLVEMYASAVLVHLVSLSLPCY